MTPYFYIIQHNNSCKYYAGSKYSKNSNPSKLLVEGGYTTSSKIVNIIIEKEGLQAFSVRKIKTFNTQAEAYNYETRFLRKVNAANNNSFINLHNNNFILGKEDNNGYFSLYASLGGKVQGKRNAENGHMLKIRQMVDEEKRAASVIKSMYENGTGWFSLTKEEQRYYASLGGKVQGKRNAENGHMLKIRQMVDEEKRIANLKESLHENKTGCFLDPVLRKRSSSLGGKTQGKANADNGHLKNISKQYWEDVRSGKITRTKKVWYNNGIEEKQIPIGEIIPESFVKGRLKK